MTSLLAPSHDIEAAKALWGNPIKPTASSEFTAEK